MIRALSERGGIAGLNYYAPFLDTDPTHPENCHSTVELIAKHAAHYKQVGGAQMITLGSDFDGIDGPHQLENAAFLPLLADALRKEGFTEDEVEGIYYRNAMRFLRKTCNNNGEYADMDKNMTLEKRIAAELYCYQGKMSVFVDDLQGHTVEVGADEEFETASTIKAFILAALYLQAQRGKADLAEEITYEQSQFVDGSGMLRALGVGAKLKVKDTATMMIICSDNIATNMIIDYLGLDTINACIRELGFAHTVLHNPLHFDRYRRLGTTTPRDYAALFARIAKGELVSREASAEMLAILRQQHYNTMLTHDFPQYYLDCEETGAPELIWVASKSGSMNACRNDGGIVHTPYGEYVIVLMNKDFHDIIEYNEHPAMVYGARVSRMILDQVLACEGRLSLS